MAARKPRRGNREGSVYQRDDGRWVGQATVPGGKPKYCYGRTKAEARSKLKKVLRAIDDGLPVPNDRLTVGKYLEEWLEVWVKPKVGTRTYESYAMQVRVHIAPELGGKRLTCLTADHVQSLINSLGAKGLKPSSIVYTRAVLRRALTVAQRRGLVQRNVAKDVEMPTVRRYKPKCPETEEVNKLLSKIAGHELEPLVVTAAFTGLRQGELLGLTWDDVDLESRRLHVRQSLHRVRGKPQLGETKSSSSDREVNMASPVVDVLLRHRVAQQAMRLKAGDRWVETNLVFTTRVGTPWDGVNLLRRFRRFLRKAELPAWRWHDLRHLFGTHALEATKNPRVVQELLGHADVRTTLSYYGHVLKDKKQEAVDALTERFTSGLDPAQPLSEPLSMQSPGAA